MSSEIKTITANLAKEQFLELEAMEMMTKPDVERMTEWLQVGTDKFDADYAKLIIIGMEENRVNPEAGWPRSFALIATRLFSEKEHIGSRKSRQEIHDLLVQKLGDQAGAILAEGWFDNNLNWENKPQWEFKPTNEDNPLKTDLADKVDEAVTEFLAERKTTEAAAAPESVPAGPAVPEWGDEQKAAAEKFYNETMKPDERVKVDALVKSLLAAGQSEEIIIEAIGNLPQAKHDWDIAKGTVADFNWIAESALGEMLKADSVRENLLAVMSIREAPKKGQDRGEQIIQHHTFYIQLADALRWRIDVIGLEREKEAKLAERKQAFIKGLDQVTLLSLPKPDGQLDERLDDLLTEVKSEFDMSLPEKLIDEVHFEEERLNQEFAKIWLRLNEDFKGGDLFIDCKAVNSEAGKVLIAMAFAKATMLTGYEFKSMEKGIQLVRTNDKAVLAVIGGEGNQFTISSENAVDLLEAAHVVGQTYLNLQGIQQDFPYFTLANLPELEKLKEPAQAVEEEAAPAPAEEAAADSDEETFDWVKEYGKPAKPAEPPVAKPREASDEAELPDLIKPQEEKPGGALLEEEGEKAVPAAELPAGPVQVGTLTEISQALKTGNGVAEVLVGPRLLQNMIRQTVNNIVQARFTKFSPEVNLDIMIDNGVIITGTIKGKWGPIKANIPIELKLGKSFNLVSFNAESKLVDKNEVERELRSVLTQLNNTFRAELAKYDITAAGMENAEIRGEQTFAKFRGKTVR